MEYYIIIAIITIGVGIAIYNFVKMGREKQIENIKEWLLFAVLEAEKVLGSKTGRIKLRYVYDLFISKFRVMAYFVSFDTFSLWVDEALDVMRDLIESNDAVKKMVGGE